MRRTQLYLEDDLWDVLHAHARSEKTTVSELVRVAVRERYANPLDQRAEAMRRIIGLRKDDPTILNAVEEVRRLRRSTRLSRLAGE